MPIYEYRCEACGHTLDALQKVSDAPLTDCPSCDESSLKRLISAPSFRLKGAGWYETDFKSDKERRRNLAESGEKKGDKSESKKDSGDKESKKAESKPADSGSSAPKSETKKPERNKGSGTEAA